VLRQCASAMAVAKFLVKHRRVSRVHYPGLASHPDHALSRRQMHGGFGGMMAFDLKGGLRLRGSFATAFEFFCWR